MAAKRILFVEDECWGVSAYFRELQKYGFESVLARNADEAMDWLQREKFDILSLDVMFPAGKLLGEKIEPREVGVRFLELLRSNHKTSLNQGIKVIILTAVNNEIEQRLKKFAIDAYLKKPVDFDVVIDTFKKISLNI